MRWLLPLLLLPAPAWAESVVATRTIRAQSVITETDLTLVDAAIPGALDDAALAAGQEARVTIYAGRPVRAADLGPPASVERNQIVALAFLAGGLEIVTEGRALERGGAGDLIRVMNIGSRSTVTGLIDADGRVRVSPENEGMSE